MYESKSLGYRTRTTPQPLYQLSNQDNKLNRPTEALPITQIEPPPIRAHFKDQQTVGHTYEKGTENS